MTVRVLFDVYVALNVGSSRDTTVYISNVPAVVGVHVISEVVFVSESI